MWTVFLLAALNAHGFVGVCLLRPLKPVPVEDFEDSDSEEEANPENKNTLVRD